MTRVLEAEAHMNLRQWCMYYDARCWLCRGDGKFGLGHHDCWMCYKTGRDPMPWAELFMNGRDANEQLDRVK